MAKPKTFLTTFANYELHEVIGHGGNGQIWRAEGDEGQVVAVKAIDAARTTTTAMKRFRNEVEFCSKDHHSNIIRILDSGRTDTGQPGYVMPLFPGTLRPLMPFKDVPSALRLFDGIAAGLEYAHDRKIWHRDLKPENVLISTERFPVVTDFGIAHFDEEYLATSIETKKGDRLANFAYAAPEQCEKGAKVDQRADVFAMGLLLNEMITGNLPRGARFRTIKEVNGEFEFLDDVVHSLISNRADDRPDSAGAVRRLIESKSLAANSKRALEALRASPPATPPPVDIKRIEIIGVDHQHGHLILRLNEAPPAAWTNGFQRSARRYSTNFHVGLIQIRGSELWLPDDAHHAQDNVNMTKDYVESANQYYREQQQEVARHAAVERHKHRQATIEAEARRLQVRSSIKI